MNMGFRLVARSHFAANLRFEQRALDRAEARAALHAGQLGDLVAGEKRADGEVGHVQPIVAADGAQERRELRRDLLAGIVERDAVVMLDELLEDGNLATKLDRLKPVPQRAGGSRTLWNRP